MRNSPGGDYIREQFQSGGCKDISAASYGTLRAAFETAWRFGNTSQQVGGFLYSAKNVGRGKVRYNIQNTAGTHSFFGHAVSDKGPGGMMGDVYQRFEWTDRSPCATR